MAPYPCKLCLSKPNVFTYPEPTFLLIFPFLLFFKIMLSHLLSKYDFYCSYFKLFPWALLQNYSTSDPTGPPSLHISASIHCGRGEHSGRAQKKAQSPHLTSNAVLTKLVVLGSMQTMILQQWVTTVAEELSRRADPPLSQPRTRSLEGLTGLSIEK